MNYVEQTRKIVDDIKEKEEYIYGDRGLKFNIETPTVIKYYKDSFKNGTFSLKKNSIFNVQYSLLLGALSGGWAHWGTGDIVVLSKNHHYFLNAPIAEISKKMPYQDMFITKVTFHEIRHIIQASGYYLSLYQYFCSGYLSKYDNLKPVLSVKYHDSLYSEIDANLYSAFRAKEYFKGNKDIEDYFNKEIGKYVLQEINYDFNSNLEKYQSDLETRNHPMGHMNEFEKFLWNADGTFKRPKEIANNAELYEFIKKNPGAADFYPRVISSDAYLSRLNINDLDKEEIEFLKHMIDENNRILNSNKYDIELCYKDNMISEDEYRKSTFLINGKISMKEKYSELFLNNTNKNDINTELSANDYQKFADDFWKNLTTPEPPKKVKFITRAKNYLKLLVDKVNNITTGALMIGLAALAESASIATGIGNPLVMAASVIGAGFAASEIYNRKNKR